MAEEPRRVSVYQDLQEDGYVTNLSPHPLDAATVKRLGTPIANAETLSRLAAVPEPTGDDLKNIEATDASVLLGLDPDAEVLPFGHTFIGAENILGCIQMKNGNFCGRFEGEHAPIHVDAVLPDPDDDVDPDPGRQSRDEEDVTGQPPAEADMAATSGKGAAPA